MIRLPAFILVGCVVCAGLIPIEFGSVGSHRLLPEARLPPAEAEPAAPEIGKLAKETPSSANAADSPLRDVRLTGVVIGPDLRMAIFAVTGTNSRVLSEGETLKGWRLERISPKAVMLSGPAEHSAQASAGRESGSAASACCCPVRPARPADGWCGGATNGCDAYYCRQFIGRHPRSDTRLSLLFSRVLLRV
jgi:hypothetical protein